MFVASHHTCWEFGPRSKKEILSYSSEHSNVVMDGIAVSCPHSAVNKTCPHMKESVSQVNRIKSADCPDHVVTRASEKVIRGLKPARNRGIQKGPVEKTRNVVFVPYVHALSHGLKNVACGYGVKLFFRSQINEEELADA